MDKQVNTVRQTEPSAANKITEPIYSNDLHAAADQALEEKARKIDAAFKGKVHDSYFPTQPSFTDISDIEVSEEDRALAKKIAGEIEAEHRNIS